MPAPTLQQPHPGWLHKQVPACLRSPTVLQESTCQHTSTASMQHEHVLGWSSINVVMLLQLCMPSAAWAFVICGRLLSLVLILLCAVAVFVITTLWCTDAPSPPQKHSSQQGGHPHQGRPIIVLGLQGFGIHTVHLTADLQQGKSSAL